MFFIFPLLLGKVTLPFPLSFSQMLFIFALLLGKAQILFICSFVIFSNVIHICFVIGQGANIFHIFFVIFFALLLGKAQILFICSFVIFSNISHISFVIGQGCFALGFLIHISFFVTDLH
jgi:hypothetical protein